MLVSETTCVKLIASSLPVSGIAAVIIGFISVVVADSTRFLDWERLDDIALVLVASDLCCISLIFIGFNIGSGINVMRFCGGSCARRFVLVNNVPVNKEETSRWRHIEKHFFLLTFDLAPESSLPLDFGLFFRRWPAMRKKEDYHQYRHPDTTTTMTTSLLTFFSQWFGWWCCKMPYDERPILFVDV